MTKNILLNFRGTEADREILKSAAKARGTDMSTLFREFIQSLSIEKSCTEKS